MTPEAFVELFGRLKASAILRTSEADAAAPAMDAAVRAGFRIVEFTLTTPERGAVEQCRSVRTKIHLLLHLGYFRARQRFFRFELPAAASATLDLHDARGLRVRRLLVESLAAGSHQLTFDGCDDIGRELAAGVYFLRLRAGDAIATHKLTLVR